MGLLGLLGLGQDNAVAEAAAVAPTEPSTITFNPDGSMSTHGDYAFQWWNAMENAVGVPTGQGAGPATMIEYATKTVPNTWKWVALIGLPLAAATAAYAVKKGWIWR